MKDNSVFPMPSAGLTPSRSFLVLVFLTSLRWFVMVVLISIHLIFSEVEYPRCFFDLTQYEYHLPVEIGLLKVCSVLNYFTMIYTATSLDGRCHIQPHRPREFWARRPWFWSCYYGEWPQGSSTSSYPSLVPRVSRALGKIVFIQVSWAQVSPALEPSWSITEPIASLLFKIK